MEDMSGTEERTAVIDENEIVRSIQPAHVDTKKIILDEVYPSMDTMSPIKLAIAGMVSEITQLCVWDLMRLRQKSTISVISAPTIPCQHDIEIIIRQIMSRPVLSELVSQVNPRELGFSADMSDVIKRTTRFEGKKPATWKNEIRGKIVQHYSFFQTLWCQFGSLADTRSPDATILAVMDNIKTHRIEQVYDIIRNHLMLLSSNLKYTAEFSARRFEGKDEILTEINTPFPERNNEALMKATTYRWCNPGSYRILKVRSMLQMDSRLIVVRPDSAASAKKELDEYIENNPIVDLIRRSTTPERAEVYISTMFAERKCVLYNIDVCPYIYDTPVVDGVSVIRLQ
jgi:hypothetical protein